MNDNHIKSSNLLSVLNSEPLEEIRSRTIANIKSDPLMTRRQKRAAIRELDSIMDYECRRRQRLMKWQWEDESRERRMRIVQKTCDLWNKLTLERKNTMLKIAHINAEIINLKVSSIERVRGLKKEDPKLREINRLKHEFIKLKMHKTIEKYVRAESERDLEERVIRRARFQQKVAVEFPDLVEEIMDDYDRELYRSVHEED